MINEEVSRSSLNLEVRLAKATSKAILDALKKVHKQIEEQGGLKNVIKNNGKTYSIYRRSKGFCNNPCSNRTSFSYVWGGG